MILRVSKNRKRKERRAKVTVGLILGLIVIFFLAVAATGIKTGNLIQKMKYDICYLMLREYTPLLAGQSPPAEYESTETSYQTQTESELEFEKILAREAAAEQPQVVEETRQADGENVQKAEPKKTISLEKLNDFDYLIQNFYTVDKTTTINSSQLSAKKLLAKDCTIQKRTDGAPQILIYHTHSQEGYKNSGEGDPSTSVMAVGDRLTQILQEKYGYHVLHHTGTYDVGDRDHAYNKSAPALEQLLKDNPSIEVVIDLHRDAVGENTRLVTEIDGKKTAQVMFFNGLSKSTSTGEIDYLRNPYIQDNLAFSLKLQIAAAELYPGFTRKIYLKSYRYNMHFCPKSMLVEVGAQTNTFKEALNAMEPLAAVIDRVLTP